MRKMWLLKPYEGLKKGDSIDASKALVRHLEAEGIATRIAPTPSVKSKRRKGSP